MTLCSLLIFCKVGLTGLEPVTLRLSSACSNQLSYRPICKFGLSARLAISADLNWWRHGDSNPRPIACKATALPTELYPLWLCFDFSKLGARSHFLRSDSYLSIRFY